MLNNILNYIALCVCEQGIHFNLTFWIGKP